MNTKIISVGGSVLVLLAVLLVGNMVVNTTPSGVAKTNYEYKIVVLTTDGCRGLSFGVECIEDNINAGAQDGWELFEFSDSFAGDVVGIFRKQQ